MKYYDVEVLSIPAGGTIDGVRKVGIYECPAERRPYKRRGEYRPLYMAFRGKGGSVKNLYKVLELKKMPIEGTEYEKIKPNIDPKVVAKIDGYRKIVAHNSNDTEEKWVFVLDIDKPINLPYEVVHERNNTTVDISHGLSDYLSSPEPSGKYKDKVLFKTKKSQNRGLFVANHSKP